MSSLGIALLILVFVGIGGVIAYNAWVVRREGRSVGSLLHEAPPAADANRTEPSLDAAQESTPFDPPPAQSYFDVNPADKFAERETVRDGDELSLDAAQEHASTARARAFIPPNTAPAPGTPEEPELGSAQDEQPIAADIEPAWMDSAKPGPEPVIPDADQPASEQAVAPEPAAGQSEPDVANALNDQPGDKRVDADAGDATDPTDEPAEPQETGSTEPPVRTDDLASDADRNEPNSPGPPDSQPGAEDRQVQEAEQPTEQRAEQAADSTTPQSPRPSDAPAESSDSGATERDRDEASLHAPAGEQVVEPPVGKPPRDPFSCTVTLTPDEPVTGGRLNELTGSFNRVGAKPVAVLGEPVDGSQAGTLQPSQRYRSVQFSLLLVNRHGPLNAMEYSEFVNRIQQVAEELDLLPDIPDMSVVLEQSRALDNEVGALDAQVAVNVVTEQAMNPGDLQLIAPRLALTEQGNNRYVRMNKQRKPVFSVSLGDQPNLVVLLLDVPRIPRDGQPLREMVECAWKCAQAFEGRMVDDAGQPIDNALFERIERQLDTHYQALEAAGVPAGSPAALRVFQ